MLPYCRSHFPAFREIVEVFGSPQIRNMGTVGGNIANASPIADSLPLYHVLECEIELASVRGRRWVNINQFYQGYKKMDLKADELITRLRMPLIGSQESLRLYKISRRRDMDISTFTAALRLTLDEGTIRSAAIAMGAVGPTVLRLRKTETFLTNQPFTIETMNMAGKLAADEITPISDVRGSADYRLQLARNIFLKFHHDTLTSSQTLNA
jgi:xanthine dehydrogenase small subunit